LQLFKHCVRLAASRTFCTAGNSNEINTPMMAITTSSSIRVNPVLGGVRIIGASHKKVENQNCPRHASESLAQSHSASTQTLQLGYKMQSIKTGNGGKENLCHFGDFPYDAGGRERDSRGAVRKDRVAIGVRRSTADES